MVAHIPEKDTSLSTSSFLGERRLKGIRRGQQARSGPWLFGSTSSVLHSSSLRWLLIGLGSQIGSQEVDR